MRKCMHEGHSHGGGQDRIETLLSYLYDHNVHHAEELTDLAAEMEKAGKTASAALVRDAQKAFAEGGNLLHEALHHYTEE